MFFFMYENETKENRKIEHRSKENHLRRLFLEPEVKSWRQLMVAFQTIFTQLEKGMTSDGFSISRFQVLLMLYFEGPLSAVDISRRLLVTRGNMSMFLKRLMSDDLVCISSQSKSKTRPLYSLTSLGNERFEDLFPRHIKRVKKLMPRLPAETLKVLKDITSAVQ